MAAALDRADGDRISDEIGLEPGLDGEQSGEALEHDMVKQTPCQWRSSAKKGLSPGAGC